MKTTYERIKPYLLVGGTVIGLGAAVIYGRDTPTEYGFLSGALDHMLLIPNAILSQTNALELSLARDGTGVLSEPRGTQYALGFATLGAYLRMLSEMTIGTVLVYPFLEIKKK